MQRRIKRDQLVVLKILDQAKASLDDPTETNRLLRELGKFLDPVTGKAIVDGESRKRLLELLQRGERAEVGAVLEAYIEAYAGQLPEGSRPARSE